MLGCDDRLNEAADMGTLNWGARSGDVFERAFEAR